MFVYLLLGSRLGVQYTQSMMSVSVVTSSFFVQCKQTKVA